MASTLLKSATFTVLLCFGLTLVRGSLDVTPENDAVLVGSTVRLTCSTRRFLPDARIMWTEFASNSGGLVVSDNKGVVPSHPNADRYSILGGDQEFHLEIRNVTKADGGAYLCQDINAGPPLTFRAYAELNVLERDPLCETYLPATGNILEDVTYSGECELRYQGNLVPIMTWTGVGDYFTNGSNPAGTVWTYIRFTAHRSIEGGAFVLRTRYPEFTPQPGYAANVPDYEFFNTGPNLIINWGPKNMEIDLIKNEYVTGDVLTCTADSKPIARYQWTNMRTLVSEPVGQKFTVTEDMEGLEQVMRCNAQVMIDGSLHTNDIFINVTVPAVTTPTTPPTTPSTTTPAMDAPCDDLTGRWSSTNPDAIICFEMDSKGNLLSLLRNGTDLYFVPGNGKTMYGDYRHIGFTGVWPNELGTAGFAGECHKCLGNEVIIMSGLSRRKSMAPGCGSSAGTQLTKLYVLTRSGPPCRGQDLPIANPNAFPGILEKMGVRAIKPDSITA